MLSVGKINFRDNSIQNDSGKAKQKYHSDVSFGLNLSQAQKGEAFSKLFSLPIEDVSPRISVNLLPSVDSKTSPVVKKTVEFIKNLSEDLSSKKGSFFDSIANASNIAQNDPERMFVDGRFKSVIASVEKRDEFGLFLDKLFAGLYTNDVELSSVEQSLVQETVIANAKLNVSSSIAQKPKQSAEALLKSQEQSESAKNEPANKLKLGRKAAHAAKMKKLQDKDVAVTVQKIGALKLAAQQIGHEIVSYQNDLSKVNSEMKRHKLKWSKVSKSQAYIEEMEAQKLEAQASYEAGRFKKMSAEELEQKLKDLEKSNGASNPFIDKKVVAKQQRYQALLRKVQKNGDEKPSQVTDNTKNNTQRLENLRVQMTQRSGEFQPIRELEVSISNLKDKKNILIAKIRGAEKRQRDVIHEQTILEKMVGQSAIKTAKEDEGKSSVATVFEAVKAKIFAKFTKPIVEDTFTVAQEGLGRRERRVLNKEKKAEAKAIRDSLSYSKGKKINGKIRRPKGSNIQKEKPVFKMVTREFTPEETHELARISSRLGQITASVEKKRPEYNKLVLKLSGGSENMFGNAAELNADMDLMRGIPKEDEQAYTDLLTEVRRKYQGTDHQFGLYEQRDLLVEEMEISSGPKRDFVEGIIKKLNEQIIGLGSKRDKLEIELKAMGVEETELTNNQKLIEKSSQRIVSVK